MASMNLAKVLNALEDKDSKETFFSKLASTTAEPVKETPVAAEPVATPVKVEEPEKVAEVKPEEMDKEMLQKVAESYDDAGRIMARGFYDELQKLAVGTQTEDTPDISPALVMNPAVQMPLGPTPAQQAGTSRISAIINQLRMATETGSSVVEAKVPTTIPVAATPVDKAPPIVIDSMKTAGDRIIEKLWNLHVKDAE